MQVGTSQKRDEQPLRTDEEPLISVAATDPCGSIMTTLTGGI